MIAPFSSIMAQVEAHVNAHVSIVGIVGIVTIRVAIQEYVHMSAQVFIHGLPHFFAYLFQELLQLFQLINLVGLHWI